jgi:hypothetical protein
MEASMQPTVLIILLLSLLLFFSVLTNFVLANTVSKYEGMLKILRPDLLEAEEKKNSHGNRV